jgi:predicted nucleic acid-binding protein
MITRVQNAEHADNVLAFSLTCQVVVLDTRLATSAANIAAQHGLSVADAVIYATAQGTGAELLTCDAHFETLDGVLYIPKHLG